jgi:hypothetical protein
MVSTSSSHEEAARLRGLLRVASIMFLVGRISCGTGILGRMNCDVSCGKNKLWYRDTGKNEL